MSAPLDPMRQLASDVLRVDGVALDHHNAQELAELVEAHECPAVGQLFLDAAAKIRDERDEAQQVAAKLTEHLEKILAMAHGKSHDWSEEAFNALHVHPSQGSWLRTIREEITTLRADVERLTRERDEARLILRESPDVLVARIDLAIRERDAAYARHTDDKAQFHKTMAEQHRIAAVAESRATTAEAQVGARDSQIAVLVEALKNTIELDASSDEEMPANWAQLRKHAADTLDNLRATAEARDARLVADATKKMRAALSGLLASVQQHGLLDPRDAWVLDARAALGGILEPASMHRIVDGKIERLTKVDAARAELSQLRTEWEKTAAERDNLRSLLATAARSLAEREGDRARVVRLKGMLEVLGRAMTAEMNSGRWDSNEQGVWKRAMITLGEAWRAALTETETA